MEEESIGLDNFCADLVSVKKYEPFVLHLLTNTQPGKWIRVDELCATLGVPAEIVEPELFATRLEDPLGDEGYSLITFYDNASLWTSAARSKVTAFHLCLRLIREVGGEITVTPNVSADERAVWNQKNPHINRSKNPSGSKHG